MNPERELRELFRGLVEQTFFAEIGICEPALTDYLTGMLTGFVHVDHIYRMRAIDGQAIRDISRLQAAADLTEAASETERTRVIHRYIGDFTLFWTGMYPETLRPRRQWGIDRLREYTLQGQRGYEIASELSDIDDVPPAELLHELSEQFDCCVHGLHLVRQSWDRLARQPRQN